MSQSVDKIKSRLSIVDVVGTYVELKKAGIHHKGLCPFHNEKSPSFTVSPERNSYYCFGCNAKGDIFSFIQEFEGVDFKHALELLADKAGVDLSEDTYAPTKKIDKDLYGVMKLANEYYVDQLKKNTEAIEYLKERGLETETIKTWEIGYAPDEWRATSDFLKEKGIAEDKLINVGLIKRKEKGTGVYDVFRGRITFPIYDNLGRLVAYTGRIFVQNENAPKYLNTPDTELFNKSEVLFGLDKAKSHIRKLDYIILAEGQMDVVMSHQAGVKNTVASSGTAFTIQHLATISSLTKRILFAFDSDEAGVNAMKRSGLLALKSGFDVKVLIPEGAKDPADIVKDDPKLWIEAVKKSIPIIDYLINSLIDQKLEERLRVKRIGSDIMPFIVSLQSELEKAHYIKKISEVFSINEQSVWQEFEKIQSNTKKKPEVYIDDAKNNKPDTKIEKITGFQRREEILAGLLYIGETNKEYFSRDDLMAKIQDIIGEEQLNLLLAKYENEKEKIIFNTENQMLIGDDPDDIRKRVRENMKTLLTAYQIEYIENKLRIIKQQIKYSEQKSDTDESEKLLKEYNALLETKNNLQTNL
jgi:DNA primase